VARRRRPHGDGSGACFGDRHACHDPDHRFRAWPWASLQHQWVARLAARQAPARYWGIAACHGVLAKDVRRFAATSWPRSDALVPRLQRGAGRCFFIGIVILAVFKPF
jgi:hypothetical protein